MVDDAVAKHFMEAFHGNMFEDGGVIDYTKAARALNHATKKKALLEQGID